MKDYSGVLTELAEGNWEEPGTGKRYDIGIKSMIIRDTLEGLSLIHISEPTRPY